MCETDESPPLAVGGGSPADPDPDPGGNRRAPDREQLPAGDEAADDEPGLDPPASAPDDVVGAVVDFVDLLVERDGAEDDDTG